jgi:V8-like Glu-specific endopeptidase
LGKLPAKNLSLEEQKLRFERQKLALDVLLKRRELSQQRPSAIREIFTNPLALAIVGAVLTLITQIVTSSLNTAGQRQAESQRAELARAAEERQAKAANDAASRTLQADLIKKFADAPDLKTARSNLEFLVDAGLLPEFEEKIRKYLEENPDGGPFTGQMTGGIIGFDDRTNLSDLPQAERAKYEGLGVVRLKGMGAPAFCTGILIAPGILATASHCLPSGREAEFQPYQPAGIDAHGYQIVMESLVTVGEEEGWGASLVRVENLPPDQKYIPLTGTPPDAGAPVRFAGFVADRNQFVLSQCQINPTGGPELRHLCDSGGGASGGPLLTTTATGRLKVLGIHLGNSEQGKRAFRADIIRQSAAVKAAFGDLPTD